MKTRVLTIIICAVIAVTLLAYYLNYASDSEDTKTFCGEDPLLTALGKCVSGGPINVHREEQYNTINLIITLGDPINYLDMVPITTNLVYSSSTPINKIIDRTYHPTNYADREPGDTGARWELIPPKLRTETRIVDENDVDVIDYDDNPSFARIQPLYATEAICSNDNVVQIKYGAPITVPIKDSVYTVYDINSIDGLIPSQDGKYVLSFASFFEQQVILPDNAEILSNTSEKCSITGIKNYEEAYYDRVVFRINQ